VYGFVGNDSNKDVDSLGLAECQIALNRASPWQVDSPSPRAPEGRVRGRTDPGWSFVVEAKQQANGCYCVDLQGDAHPKAWWTHGGYPGRSESIFTPDRVSYYEHEQVHVRDYSNTWNMFINVARHMGVRNVSEQKANCFARMARMHYDLYELRADITATDYHIATYANYDAVLVGQARDTKALLLSLLRTGSQVLETIENECYGQ